LKSYRRRVTWSNRNLKKNESMVRAVDRADDVDLTGRTFEDIS